MDFKKVSRVLVYISVFLIPFYFFRFSVFGIKTNAFEASVLISLIVTLLENIKNKRLEIKKEWILPSILLLFALISVFVSGDKEKALGIFKGWFLIPIIFAWLITKNFNKKNILNLAIPLYVSLMFISLWAILQKIGFFSTLFYQVGDASFNQYIQDDRLFGPFESPNFLAMYLVPASFLSLSLIELLKKKQSKFLILLSFLLPMAALHFSVSRAGIISFALCFLILMNYRFVNLQKSKSRRPFFTFAFISFFLIINAGYLFFAENYYKPSGGGDKIRIEIYKYSTELLKNHPIGGIGLGGFHDSIDLISKNNESFQVWAMPYALHPHNLLLALWLNLGILGLAVFIWILVQTLKELFFNDSNSKAYFIAAIFAIMIQGLFDTTYFKNDLSAIFWLIWAGAVILGQKNENREV